VVDAAVVVDTAVVVDAAAAVHDVPRGVEGSVERGEWKWPEREKAKMLMKWTKKKRDERKASLRQKSGIQAPTP